MLHTIFFEPRIPGNTEVVIRLNINTGSMLHLVGPLLDMDDAKLCRAGPDHHGLANTCVHATRQGCLEQIPGRISAFTSHTERLYTQVDWRGDDAFLFGSESADLPQEILDHPGVSTHLRILTVEGSRFLNPVNSAAIDLYEA